MDANFHQKLANWENGLLNRYLESCEGDPCEDCNCDFLDGDPEDCVCHCHDDYEPDPDRFRDDPDYEPYYGD